MKDTQSCTMEIDLDKCLGAGCPVDLLPRRSEVLEAKQVRRAMVLGIQNGDLVLSMPEPPLPTPLLGQALEVTFLSDPQDAAHARRYGYYTLVLDTLEHYPDQDQDGSGVVVLYPDEKDLLPANLRAEKRFRVSGRKHLALNIKGLNGVALRDISLRGLCFSYDNSGQALCPGQTLELELLIQGEATVLRGQVVEVSQDQHGKQVRMELDSLPLDLWSYMLQVLHKLEKSGKVASA